MVDVLLSSKKARHGCHPVEIFIKHNTCPSKYFAIPLKCPKQHQGLHRFIRILVENSTP